MPGRLRSTKLADRRELNGWHVQQLLCGSVMFPGLGFSKGSVFIPPRDMDTAGAAWNDLRAELVSWHVEVYPGSRPWAWWACDAPQPRRLLSGAHECRRWDVMQRDGRGLHFGRPPIYSCPKCFAEVYETQAVYLHRLDLLTSGEQRLIDDPEVWWAYEDDCPRVIDPGECMRRYGEG